MSVWEVRWMMISPISSTIFFLSFFLLTLFSLFRSFFFFRLFFLIYFFTDKGNLPASTTPDPATSAPCGYYPSSAGSAACTWA